MQGNPAEYNVTIWQGRRIALTHEGCNTGTRAFPELPSSTVTLGTLIQEAQLHHGRVHKPDDDKLTEHMRTDALEDLYAKHSERFRAFLNARTGDWQMAAGLADLLAAAMNDAHGLGECGDK